MKVLDHQPAVWFLLQEGDSLFLDARCSTALSEYSFLLALDEGERREYQAKGRTWLSELAKRIEDSAPAAGGSRSSYAGRDSSIRYGKQVTAAINQWRAANGGSADRAGPIGRIVQALRRQWTGASSEPPNAAGPVQAHAPPVSAPPASGPSVSAPKPLPVGAQFQVHDVLVAEGSLAVLAAVKRESRDPAFSLWENPPRTTTVGVFPMDAITAGSRPGAEVRPSHIVDEEPAIHTWKVPAIDARFMGDGTHVALVGGDEDGRIYDLAQRTLRRIPGGLAWPPRVAVASATPRVALLREKSIAVVGGEGALIWSTAQGPMPHLSLAPTRRRTVALDARGERIAWATGDTVVVRSIGGAEHAEWGPTPEFRVPTGAVSHLEFDRSGRYLAVTGTHPTVPRVAAGTFVRDLLFNDWLLPHVFGAQLGVHHLVHFTRDGARLVIGTDTPSPGISRADHPYPFEVRSLQNGRSEGAAALAIAGILDFSFDEAGNSLFVIDATNRLFEVPMAALRP